MDEPRPVEAVLPEGGTDTAAWTDATAHAAALAESEERFRLAMDHSAVAMNITGPDGRFLRVNDAMTDLLGRARPDLLACTWQELTHPDDLRADEALAGELLAGLRDHYRLTKRYLRADGSIVWGDLTVSCVRGDDGAIDYAIAQIIDVTERVEALRTLDATWATMLDPHVLFRVVASPDGTLADLVYERANDAALAYLQRSADQLLGHAITEVFSGEAVDRMHDWCSTAYREGSIALDDVAMTSAVEPERRWFDIRAVRVESAISFTWRDVSARHREAEQLARSEARFRLLADNATDVIVRTGADGRIEWVSPAVTETLGWRIDEVVGQRMPDLMHPDDLARVRTVQQGIIAAGGTEGRTIARFRRSDGGWQWMSDHGRAVLDASGRLAGGIDVLRDVQAEQEARLALEERERELRGIVDTFVDPWVRLAAVRDADGHIVDFTFTDANDAACAFNEIPRQRLIGARLLDLLPEHEPSGIFQRYAAVVDTGRPLVEDDQPFTDARSGMVRRYDNRAVKLGDGISLMWRDVTDRFAARQQLRHQADHDVLTGVANRRQLEARLAALLRQRPRTGSRVAVLYCDLDHFKAINDTLGHAAGDQVLTSVASAVSHAVREGDIVARLGGDEFVIVLTGVRDAQDAADVAGKIRRAARTPVVVGADVVEPGLSVGVALAESGEDMTRVLARADAALYAAKQAGRDRVVVDDGGGTAPA